MLIPFTGPLDLPATLESGQAFRWRMEDPSEPGEGQWYYGVLHDNIVKLRHVPEGIEFTSAPDEPSVVEPLLRDFLRLHDDLEEIYRAICSDHHIEAAVDSYRGLRLVRQDPWECLISFICSATSNIPRISANVEDVSSRFGRPLRLDGHARGGFPGPEALAEAGEQALRDLGLGFRAKYVAKTATAVANGDVDLFYLREAPYEEALEVLTTLSGVADKVANCVLLFSLDKLEAFPVDVWIRRVLRERYAEARDIPDRQMRLWAQGRFGVYSGYANQYMFHSRRLQGRG